MATPTCTLVCLFSAAFGAASAATCGPQQAGSDLYGGDSQGVKYSDVFNPSNLEPGECCNFCCNIQQWGVVSTVPTAWAYNSIQTPMYACYCKSGSGITSNACPDGKTCYSGTCPSMTKVNASNVVAVEHSTQPVAVRGKGFIPPTSPVPMLNSSLLRFSNVPDAIDWTTKGATTEIRDQGTCGCCWAFATAEAVESAAFMAGYSLEKLSAGQICRCDSSDSGCEGGNPSSAFDYVRSKGLDSYAHDPYGDQVDKGSTEKCEWDGSVAATITGYKQVAQDEESLAAALATYGPLAVCINAKVWPNDQGRSDWSWTGIAPWADQCTNEQADHCVQLVGYDKTAPTPYWKLRNQWGNTWGESGYVRLPFGSDSCGITQAAYIVEGAKLSGAQILV